VVFDALTALNVTFTTFWDVPLEKVFILWTS